MKKKLCQSCAKRVISFPEALEGIQYLRGQDEWGEGGQKLSIFVHTQGIKTILAGVGGGDNGKIMSTYMLMPPYLIKCIHFARYSNDTISFIFQIIDWKYFYTLIAKAPSYPLSSKLQSI